MRRPMKAPPTPEKSGPRTNREIRVPTVQLIDAEGQNRGPTAIQDAMQLAEDAGLDLVEIVPNANPPVCKI
ncbi:MAG: translation initiation factor IF-3, partial [Rhodoblastus sp.]|nr:translation initiation factor IF-3 [Rhodoblastus sp.]